MKVEQQGRGEGADVSVRHFRPCFLFRHVRRLITVCPSLCSRWAAFDVPVGDGLGGRRSQVGFCGLGGSWRPRPRREILGRNFRLRIPVEVLIVF